MTVQVYGTYGLAGQFSPCDVLFVASERGKDIDKWDMNVSFHGLDMDDLRSRSSYLIVELRDGSKHVYPDDHIVQFK